MSDTDTSKRDLKWDFGIYAVRFWLVFYLLVFGAYISGINGEFNHIIRYT